jgi:Zn ribbon nucleic-acid-binding protein
MAYKKNKTSVCPVCGSDKIASWTGSDAQYFCEACGYAGQLLIEKQLPA